MNMSLLSDPLVSLRRLIPPTDRFDDEPPSVWALTYLSGSLVHIPMKPNFVYTPLFIVLDRIIETRTTRLLQSTLGRLVPTSRVLRVDP